MRYQVLLINADSATSRLEQMKHQFSRAGMHFSRVVGLASADVSDELYQQVVDSSRNHRDYFHNLSSRDVATYLSHRQAWQELVNSGVDYGVILEDDTVLIDGFNELPNRIRDILVPWNMIKLAEPYKRERSTVYTHVGAATVVRYEVVPRGSCAYVLKRSAAEQLLARTETFFRPLDVDFQWWWEMGLNVIGLKPYPVKLSHRLGRDMRQAYMPQAKAQRRYVKLRHKAKFWWLNKQSSDSNPGDSTATLGE